MWLLTPEIAEVAEVAETVYSSLTAAAAHLITHFTAHLALSVFTKSTLFKKGFSACMNVELNSEACLSC